MCWCVYVSQNGATPLWYAAGEGHLSLVQLLLSAHADVNPIDWVSESKELKLYHSLEEVLFILLFNHDDGDGDNYCLFCC